MLEIGICFLSHLPRDPLQTILSGQTSLLSTKASAAAAAEPGEGDRTSSLIKNKEMEHALHRFPYVNKNLSKLPGRGRPAALALDGLLGKKG